MGTTPVSKGRLFLKNGPSAGRRLKELPTARRQIGKFGKACRSRASAIGAPKCRENRFSREPGTSIAFGLPRPC
jgi:hypothetical protein